jgi:predicted nucleotidyltransferase
MLTAFRRALNSATRFRVVRAPTLGAIGAITRVSTRLLEGVDGFAAVYARGSYARGDFRPFLSDVDFAIAVRAPAGQGYQSCQELSRRLGLVRATNPFVRDPWQTIVTAPQWPLVARWGRLLGTEDWRLLAGTPPWTPPVPVDARTESAAWWNRQHFWTATAVRQALRSQTSVRELEASLKKARHFGRRLVTPAAGPATPHGVLVELDRSAARLVHDLGLAAPWRPSPERTGPPTVTDRELRALRAIEAVLDLERDGATVLAIESVLYIVSGRAWTAEEYRVRLDALAEIQRSTGVLAFLYSPASFALAPLTRRLRVLRAGEMMRGPADAAEPVLLREQLLYQSLYLGTHLWVVAGRAKPGHGLERHVADALEACGYFASGTLSPDARDARATLAQVASLDPELGERVRRAQGLEARLAVEGALTPPLLFELGTLAVERLTELLSGLGAPADGVPVAAGS